MDREFKKIATKERLPKESGLYPTNVGHWTPFDVTTKTWDVRIGDQVKEWLEIIEPSKPVDLNEEIINHIDSFLNPNFWMSYTFENGYPIEVISKSDFLAMRDSLKLKLSKK